MDSAILGSLSDFPRQLQELYATVPADRVHWAPASWDGVPSEAFTAIEQVCHVRDIEVDGYQVRLRRMTTEDNPSLASIDSYAVRTQRRYHEADTAKVFASIRAARATTLEMIRSLNDTQLRRTGVFEGYGPVTVIGLIHFLCSHDQQHLSGLHWLLGKIRSQ